MSHKVRRSESRREFIAKGLGVAVISASVLSTLLPTPAHAIALPGGGGSGGGGGGSGGGGGGCGGKDGNGKNGGKKGGGK